MERDSTFSLRKVKWNQDTQRNEPGEIINEVPCIVEVTPDEIKATLLEGLAVSAGEHYFVVVLDNGDLHAYHAPIEKDVFVGGFTASGNVNGKPGKGDKVNVNHI